MASQAWFETSESSSDVSLDIGERVSPCARPKLLAARSIGWLLAEPAASFGSLRKTSCRLSKPKPAPIACAVHTNQAESGFAWRLFFRASSFGMASSLDFRSLAGDRKTFLGPD